MTMLPPSNLLSDAHAPAPSGRGQTSDLPRRAGLSNSKYGFMMNVPGLLMVLLWVFIPAMLVLAASFLRYDNVRPVTFNGLSNYQHLFRDRLFWVGMEKIAVFCIGTTVLTSLGGMVLALILSGIVRAGGLFRSLMIIPWAVPAVVSGIIWKWIFSPDFGVISDILMKLHL
ncbi:MAG TPA: sugar ABC transporter permease, partial [Thermodesulfobacteriota bacterium]|nr:sugar ABC transporter permease [Thermodesulfobacteriota bacterium]